MLPSPLFTSATVGVNIYWLPLKSFVANLTPLLEHPQSLGLCGCPQGALSLKAAKLPKSPLQGGRADSAHPPDPESLCLSMRQHVSGAPFNTLETPAKHQSHGLWQNASHLAVALCKSPSSTRLPFKILSWKQNSFPLSQFHLLPTFSSQGPFGESIRYTDFWGSFWLTAALPCHHPQSCVFPTVAPTRSNCLARCFWHHSLLPWQVPPIQ